MKDIYVWQWHISNLSTKVYSVVDNWLSEDGDSICFGQMVWKFISSYMANPHPIKSICNIQHPCTQDLASLSDTQFTSMFTSMDVGLNPVYFDWGSFPGQSHDILCSNDDAWVWISNVYMITPKNSGNSDSTVR